MQASGVLFSSTQEAFGMVLLRHLLKALGGNVLISPLGAAAAPALETKRSTFMIFGAHVIVYSNDAMADRAFFRDVLGFSSVDAGHDWLIFALPPAEIAVHPAEGTSGHELYLMSDDLTADMAALKVKAVQCSKIEEVRWGLLTRIQLPSGGVLKLYQAKHPSPLVTTSQ